MGPYYFLTGFTIGHDYEWQWGVSVSINWCVVGCTSTYGIQLNAGFNYAFGLRFPIQATLKYQTVVHPNNTAEAKLTPQFVPIEGDEQRFLLTPDLMPASCTTRRRSSLRWAPMPASA